VPDSGAGGGQRRAMEKAILATAPIILVVITQSALLLLAMMFHFLPFSHAPKMLGLTAGYLTFLLYPLLLYFLLKLAHKWLRRLPMAWLEFSWRRLPTELALGFGIEAVAVLGVVALAAL